MKKTFYGCDKCGKEVQSNSQYDSKVSDGFVTFGIYVEKGMDLTKSSSYGHATVGKHKTWCTKCALDGGIIEPEEKNVVPIAAPPTFEEILREIVIEEVYNARQG